MGGVTLVPRSRRTVHAAGQVGSPRKNPGLAPGRFSKGSDPTGAGARELAGEMHREGAESAVRVVHGIGGPPSWLLLDEGVVGRQGVVGRTRMEVQQLGPLAPADRHPAAAGRWVSRGQESQISNI